MAKAQVVFPYNHLLSVIWHSPSRIISQLVVAFSSAQTQNKPSNVLPTGREMETTPVFTEGDSVAIVQASLILL
jgi:hypothetical protein